jgi:hypothetical protein
MGDNDPAPGGPGGNDSADDQRERAAAAHQGAPGDERESALRAREVRADAREAHEASFSDEVQGILDRADERDERADARDEAATARDSAASLHSFLHDDEYDAALKARRSAAMDRQDSHTDRGAAGEDRSRLSEGIAPASDGDPD